MTKTQHKGKYTITKLILEDSWFDLQSQSQLVPVSRNTWCFLQSIALLQRQPRQNRFIETINK